jgi:hypothetical protein
VSLASAVSRRRGYQRGFRSGPTRGPLSRSTPKRASPATTEVRPLVGMGGAPGCPGLAIEREFEPLSPRIDRVFDFDRHRGSDAHPSPLGYENAVTLKRFFGFPTPPRQAIRRSRCSTTTPRSWMRRSRRTNRPQFVHRNRRGPRLDWGNPRETR